MTDEEANRIAHVEWLCGKCIVAPMIQQVNVAYLDMRLRQTCSSARNAGMCLFPKSWHWAR